MALAEARAALFRQAVGVLAGNMSKAAQTLVDLLADPDPTLRLRAAGKLLESAVKGVELAEIEARIHALENRSDVAAEAK